MSTPPYSESGLWIVSGAIPDAVSAFAQDAEAALLGGLWSPLRPSGSRAGQSSELDGELSQVAAWWAVCGGPDAGDPFGGTRTLMTDGIATTGGPASKTPSVG